MGDRDKSNLSNNADAFPENLQTIESAKTDVNAVIEGSKINEVEAKLLKQLTNVMLTSTKNSLSVTSDKTKKVKQDFKFWKTQPVPDLGEKIVENEPIDPDKSNLDIRVDPYSLPSGFDWSIIDINDEDQLHEVYELLNKHYVEDDDHMFRFAYTNEFLRWTMQPPGWKPEWHLGVRVIKNSMLVGFIAGMPCEISVHNAVKKMVEINFLCVHSRLRDKRMAPVLIREITRRVHMHGIFQAVYTSGTFLPRPVSTCRYWHRPLNPKVLIEIGFSQLSHTMTLQRSIKLYRLPNETCTVGFRELTEKDLAAARNLMQTYMLRFKLFPVFSEAEFRHWFMPRSNVVYCYVVESKDGEVTDMCSFYSLPSTVIHSKRYPTLRAAYSFFNFSTKTPMRDLMRDALIKARQLQFDVFNALDLMENKTFLEELKFGIGDGNLYYYLYNWRCPELKPEEIDLVLQ